MESQRDFKKLNFRMNCNLKSFPTNISRKVQGKVKPYTSPISHRAEKHLEENYFACWKLICKTLSRNTFQSKMACLLEWIKVPKYLLRAIQLRKLSTLKEDSN